ncbi:MAG: histidinol-phosphatase HisJ family protein [Elusimicrobia bacterium]|nr:histidinol-phosphatase HisJ family protein [Elusimicrobiota bacterium]
MDSYHNHTTFSDGKAEVADMVRAAEYAGLGEVGISDHLTVHPEGKAFRWAMPAARLGEYCAEVRGAAAGIPVRLGIEADYFPDTVEQTRGLLSRHPFDFVIGSVHFADGFLFDESRQRWAELTPDECAAKWRLYWERVAGLARSRAFDVMGHLDLPKKFGFWMRGAGLGPALAALDALAEAGMALELNTSGWHQPCREPYPSLELLREACRRGIPVIVSADAHGPEDVVRGFADAAALARQAGYTQTARYEGRRRSLVRLG